MNDSIDYAKIEELKLLLARWLLGYSKELDIVTLAAIGGEDGWKTLLTKYDQQKEKNMKMKRVQGILAIADNNVIGQGEKLPWSHAGDLRRFREVTAGQSLLMGFPTYAGIAKFYTKPGNQVLPGRHIFIVGRPPFDIDKLNVDDSNVTFIETTSPQEDIKRCLSMIKDDQVLLIAGGGKIYRDYLPFAEKIYLTKVHISPKIDQDTVRLAPELNDIIFHSESWQSVAFYGLEIIDDLKVGYYTFG